MESAPPSDDAILADHILSRMVSVKLCSHMPLPCHLLGRVASLRVSEFQVLRL